MQSNLLLQVDDTITDKSLGNFETSQSVNISVSANTTIFLKT
jgi:hypothetical protein